MEELNGSERLPAPVPAGELCPDCGGRGWKVVADGGAGTAVRCDCLKQQRGSVYLQQAGIPERYRRCRLSNFETTGNPEVRAQLLQAHRISEHYVNRFFDAKENRFRESGLIYVGPPGIGKTHLAVPVLSELVERYLARARFVHFTALLHQIRSSFDPQTKDTKHSILRPIIDAELLVLDELGAQKPTEWVMDTLYLVINTRYTQRLPTIFTTNYSLDGGTAETGQSRPGSRQTGAAGGDAGFDTLTTRISALLVSRLYEMAQVVQLAGRDFRRNIKMHQHRIGRSRLRSWLDSVRRVALPGRGRSSPWPSASPVRDPRRGRCRGRIPRRRRRQLLLSLHRPSSGRHPRRRPGCRRPGCRRPDCRHRRPLSPSARWSCGSASPPTSKLSLCRAVTCALPSLSAQRPCRWRRKWSSSLVPGSADSRFIVCK